MSASLKPEVQYPCPCCGHRVLAVAPPGSWLTCPVCYWTDEDTDDDAARSRLIEAQRSFDEIGASEPGWLQAVRPPTAAERRPDGWTRAFSPTPRERARDALVAQIRQAFAGVSPEGRIPLCASYRHDFDCAPSLDWDDSDQDWQQLPADVLDFFGQGTTPFVFGNDESFRYYMPAFMLRSLRLGYSLTAVRALGAASPPGARPAQPGSVELLDARQRAAIVGFLEYLVLYEAPAPWAERALARTWRPGTS